jgi:hypothetical protein
VSFRRPLPPELDDIGARLEAAAARSLARRRARRTAFLNGAATVAVAIPLAISAASADLNHQAAQTIGTGHAGPAINWSPGFDLSLSHIRDERIRSAPQVFACLDGKECRVREPFFLESPMGKV